MLLFTPAAAWAGPSLPQPAIRLWAVCEVPSCRAAGPIDFPAWAGGGQDRLALTSLENRLRCVCGARRARLTTEPPATVRAGGPAPYLFV